VTFFATDLAVDARLKRVAATAATVASTTGESSTVAAAAVATATIATSAPSTAEITPATLALGGEVHGRLAASIVHLQALLVGDQLGVKLGDGDGLDACCYDRHDLIIILIQHCQHVGHEFLILESSTCCCHLNCQAFNLGEILADSRCTFGG
jgi:hypothetical protein